MKRKKYKHHHLILTTQEQRNKYMGDPTNIIMRSSWEEDFFLMLMNNPNIIRVGSEEFSVKYYNVEKKRFARYFIDFYFEANTATRGFKRFLVEVKPFYQTQPPKRETNYSVMSYCVNLKKWESAIRYSRTMGFEFLILTENPDKKENYKIWTPEELKLPLHTMNLQ